MKKYIEIMLMKKSREDAESMDYLQFIESKLLFPLLISSWSSLAALSSHS